MPISSPSGPGRRSDVVALIRPEPDAPNLCRVAEILLERRPSELRAEDVLGSLDRRVGGTPPVADHQAIMMHAKTAGTVAEIARNRALRAGMLKHGGPIRGPSARLVITEEGRRRAGPDACFRLASLEHDPVALTLQRLHAMKRWWRAPEWKALRARRERDALFGFFVVDESDSRGRTLLLNQHALQRAYRAGLIEVKICEEPFSREELTGPVTLLERLERLNHALAGWATELELTLNLLMRIGACLAAMLTMVRLSGLV